MNKDINFWFDKLAKAKSQADDLHISIKSNWRFPAPKKISGFAPIIVGGLSTPKRVYLKPIFIFRNVARYELNYKLWNISNTKLASKKKKLKKLENRISYIKNMISKFGYKGSL